MKSWCLVAAATLSLTAPVRADIAMSGDFKAAKACDALQSIRKGTNPGDVKLTPGQAYPLLAKNRPDATHYRVAVEGANPRERWVEIGCGSVAGEPAPAPAAAPGGGKATHVLALGWEPAFCEEHGDKAECQRETQQTFDATHFILHGLWPQPIGNFYCGVDRSLQMADRHSHWWELPEPELSAPTRVRLTAVMPGVLSGLERHEWIKHGTCFHSDANAYFNRAAQLAEAVNASAAQALFEKRIGQRVSAEEIRAAFDKTFGAGAGDRVEVHCQGDGDEREISEIVVSLAGDVSGSAPLADLIRAAPAVDAKCPGGNVAEAER
jgi:ribonuclease T2